MRVFDFDGTIYDGESSVDFFLFELKRHPENLLLLPKVLHSLIRYKRLKVSFDELWHGLERYGERFLATIPDLMGDIKLFWDMHSKKIKKSYLKMMREDDVILSAGPDFLIKEMAGRLGIKTVIASEYDFSNKKILTLCYRDRKCDCFHNHFPGRRMDEFYTDSENDRAVFALADKVFIVKGDNIKELKDI